MTSERRARAVQDELTRLGHGLLGQGDRRVEGLQGGLNQEGIVERGTDPDPPFGRQADGQAQHFCPIRLHREIAERAGIDRAPNVQRPAKDRCSRLCNMA